MNIDRSGVKRILVIKLRAIGDVLLSTIVLRNIRFAFPDARIEILTEPPARPVAAIQPDVNEVVVFNPKTMNGWELISTIRSRGYDLIFDLFGNPRSALVTRLSGAKYRVGYRFRGRAYAYNILTEPRGAMVHNTQFNLDALEAAGIAIQDRSIYFPVSREDDAYIESFFTSERIAGPCIALGTSGSWYTKRWSLERFADLGEKLARRFKTRIVLLWGPGERADVDIVNSLMGHTAIIPPPTTLTQLGALLKRCTFMVANDSGPMHIGAAVGTPVLGIYGPTNPMLQGPYGEKHMVIRNEGLGCLGCNLTACPIGHPCMNELSVDIVFDAVQQLMRKNGITL